METLLARAIGQDITPTAVTEKRLLLSRLLARLAHEIRNPLSSLDVHVQLLDEDLGQLAPDVREQIAPRFDVIHGELRRLENIVKQFLRLAGPSDLTIERLQLPGILKHVSELLRPEAAARDIEIEVDAAADLPEFEADPAQLTQALLNLVINAIQAVERRGRVQILARLVPSERVAIAVVDSGPGVPEDERAAIFDPYFTTKPEGSGLGLWIAQQIALAHGGSLEVSGSPTAGAIFTLTLPLRPPTPAHG